MSKDKHRKHDRAMSLIASQAIKGRIYLDRSGRMPSNHREIRHLVKKGLVKIEKIGRRFYGYGVRGVYGMLTNSPWNEPAKK